MKKGKQIVALQAVDNSEARQFLEREISVTLEQGGHISLKFCGDNISGGVAGIIHSVEGGWQSFEREIPISVTFHYWHLNEDLTDLNISAGTCDFPNGGEPVVTCCRRMIHQAKRNFVTALARQEITLKGPIGQLEAA